MTAKVKSVIGNGLPYGIVFFALSTLIGFIFHINFNETLPMAILIGTSALLINGLLYNRFSKPLKVLEEISIKLSDQESVLLEAPANHLIDESLVPGKLFLTDQRLVFKTLGTNNKSSHEYSWQFAMVDMIDYSKSIWNAGGEFLVKAGEDVTLVFEVNKLREWTASIKNLSN